MKQKDMGLTRNLKIIVTLLVVTALSGALPALAALTQGGLNCGGACCMPQAGHASHQANQTHHRQSRLEANGCCCCDHDGKACDLWAVPNETKTLYRSQNGERVTSFLPQPVETRQDRTGTGPARMFRTGAGPPMDGSGLYLINVSFLH